MEQKNRGREWQKLNKELLVYTSADNVNRKQKYRVMCHLCQERIIMKAKAFVPFTLHTRIPTFRVWLLFFFG